MRPVRITFHRKDMNYNHMAWQREVKTICADIAREHGSKDRILEFSVHCKVARVQFYY